MIGDDFLELSNYQIRPEIVHLLPRGFCLRNQVVVLELPMEATAPVTVGMLNPDDTRVHLQIADYLRRQIVPVRLNSYEIERAIAEGWGESQRPGEHAVSPRPIGPDAAAPQLLDHILATAIQAGASDIHLDSYTDDFDLRLRIDGILHQVFTHVNPLSIGEVINRLKVLSGLDITERRRPQDGRFRARFTGIDDGRDRVVDFRVSIVPSPAGEDAVLRVLDAKASLLPVSILGMPPDSERVFLRLLDNPEGLILVTGPTGCGKTTTLYAALSQVNDGRRKLITAEDPIEYNLPKINQKQVNAQMPMATLLRSLLRQDPDVMLVGEIRDPETGSTALAAASTGHVVLGTLHTSDALGAVPRLRGLGLDNADIADALLAVVAQRLVRRVCPDCAAPCEPTPAERELLGVLLDGITPISGQGCSTCLHTGYKGRTGVFELLLVDAPMQQRIADGAHTGELGAYAWSQGFRTMVDSALDKLIAGVTTVAELVRVLPYRQIMAARHQAGKGPSAPTSTDYEISRS